MPDGQYIYARFYNMHGEQSTVIDVRWYIQQYEYCIIQNKSLITATDKMAFNVDTPSIRYMYV